MSDKRIEALEARIRSLEDTIESYINEAADHAEHTKAMVCVLGEHVYPGRTEEFMADAQALIDGAIYSDVPTKMMQ
jgi:hypothetical protein